MKIATWNLEWSGPTGGRIVDQLELLDAQEADVVALTEVSASAAEVFDAIEFSHPLASGTQRWVGIHSVSGLDRIEPSPEVACMAVGGRITVGEHMLAIYASVLPWLNALHQSPEFAQLGTTPREIFAHALDRQAEDVERIQRDHPKAMVIWAGDFNQTLAGPLWGGSTEQRELLEAALERLGLVAWNARSEHAKSDMCSIDLICGPKYVGPVAVTRFGPESRGVVLSDHAGYTVEV